MNKVLVSAGIALAMASPARAALDIGEKAPDFSVPAALAGKQYNFSLAETLAKGPVVLYFFPAAFSPGCSVEAHEFAEATDKFAALGATVIGISTDDDRNAAMAWLKQSNATVAHYIDSGPRWTLEHMFGASRIPVTVLVDAGGRVVARFAGARDWSSAESIKLIERAFANAAGRPPSAR